MDNTKTVNLKNDQTSRVDGPLNDSAKSDGPEASAFDFEGWAILELMGHRKLGGYVRMSGPLIRIDIRDEDDKPVVTQWYGGHSLYCLTPTTEAVAKRLTRALRPEPVAPYELALPEPRHDPDYDPDF